ncbi:AraC family transcriptional regulator [Spongiibacter taiwanensis]|uniref:AraC family transcriptional regulator n=1 Tax=Spongiibacter taiwanensis TaxID=1748242 RepID=UPI002035128A|nr:AraC family transcriptional regulator [Spongiibacter taiwanensis]USA44363.1 AraC family transcriptional regulator [Spongiibacter taiwanensis]
MHAPTVAIYFVRAATLHLADQPDVLQHVLRKNHIPPTLLEKEYARVPGEDFSNLLRDTMLITQDEQLGHAAVAQPLGSWQTVTQLTINAPHLGEALRRFARFYRLLPWGVATRLVEEGNNARFVMESTSDKVFSNYLYESFLFYVSRYSNWLINKQIPLISAGFNFPPSPQRAEYRNLFLTSHFEFNQRCCYISFPRRYLQEPIRQSPDNLKKFLEHTNLAMVAQHYRHKNWRTQVQQILLNNLARSPGIAEIASTLSVHPHTLRARLRDEGVKFREIRDQLRCEVAIDLLRQQRCTVEETANRLGYSETSAFSRAFKSWMGVSPYKYQNYRAEDESGEENNAAEGERPGFRLAP